MVIHNAICFGDWDLMRLPHAILYMICFAMKTVGCVVYLTILVSFLKMLCLTIFIMMINHSKVIMDLCPMSELTRVSSDLGVSVTCLILTSLS